MPKKGHDYFSERERAGHMPVKYNTAPQGKDTDTVARSLLGQRGTANLQQTDDLNLLFPQPCFRDRKGYGLVCRSECAACEQRPKGRLLHL